MTTTTEQIDNPSVRAARSEVIADVARAASIVGASWPLTSFVAVNPLDGLTEQTFADAAAMARRWYPATSHLSLDAYRAEHEAGAITDADLDAAIAGHVPQIAERSSVDIGGAQVPVQQLVRHDVLHGPTCPVRPPVAHNQAAETLDDILTTWCAAYVDEAHVPWSMPDRDLGFFASWKSAAATDRRLASVVGRDLRARLSDISDDAAGALVWALERLGVDDLAREDAVRRLLLRTPGWAAFAKWCDDWAPADRTGPRLRLVDLAAARAVMETMSPAPLSLAAPDEVDDDLVDERVDAILMAFGRPESDDDLDDVIGIIRALDISRRSSIWLAAHEGNFRDRILAMLEPSSARERLGRADAQVVCCIDVRSEGLRRHLETLGNYDTYGFAGFFGVPVRWRALGSTQAQARCPVLVSPRHEVAEVVRAGDATDYLTGCSTTAGAHDAFHAAKGGLGSPFALAESAGWFAGPIAAVRTLAPRRSPRGSSTATPEPPKRSSWWSRTPPPTTPVVDDGAGIDLHAGLSLDERTLFAEAIVRTMGLSDLAPIVVLCGHGSATVNNPHASSLDCGACGGAPGGASARIAAAILNDAAVRSGLIERGIELPADTWFVAAEHDTTSDVVSMFDVDLVPEGLRSGLDRLASDLAIAGEHNAHDRARRLPGPADRVRDRGRDWAQVRPEWGLAGNAAFVIGPRSITAGRDLSGRAFLHSYDADADTEGVALETIMTAPLVVAQWISAQYYFSTVDNDVFGAGDKMLHNPVGGIGVVVGESGDLAVGLPMQSVMLGERRAHDPLRLLALVQAPLDRIEGIILRNPGLRDLVEGEWIHVVARATEHDAWTTRQPDGTWVPWHPADSPQTTTDPDEISLEIR